MRQRDPNMLKRALLGGCGVVVLVAAVVLSAETKATPLIDKARAGDLASVRKLLTKANVNATEADGTSALHWAAHRDDAAMVDALIAAGANVNAVNHYAVMPLALAAENGNAAVIGRLLTAGANANAATFGGETVLHTAARTGKVDAVQVLLSHGAAVDARESFRGQTPLMWAAAEGNRDVLDALIKAGADVQARSKGPASATQGPASRRPATAAGTVPTNPAGVATANNPALNRDGAAPANAFGQMTAIMFAAQRGQLEAAKALIVAGANVNDATPLMDRLGPASTLHVAIANGAYELAAYLVDHGADPNASGIGWAPLHQLAIARAEPGKYMRTSQGWTAGPRLNGSVDGLTLAKKLIEHGADINARSTEAISVGYQFSGPPWNRVGGTPFTYAAKALDVQLLRVLAAAGADINIPTADNSTALMIAAGVGQKPGEDGGDDNDAFEAVKVCIELGMDVTAANDGGWTALHGAALRGFNPLVQFLVDKGAKLDVRLKKVESRFAEETKFYQSELTPLQIADGVTIQVIFNRQPQTAALLRKIMTERGVPIDEPEGALVRGVR